MNRCKRILPAEVLSNSARVDLQGGCRTRRARGGGGGAAAGAPRRLAGRDAGAARRTAGMLEQTIRLIDLHCTKNPMWAPLAACTVLKARLLCTQRICYEVNYIRQSSTVSQIDVLGDFTCAGHQGSCGVGAPRCGRSRGQCGRHNCQAQPRPGRSGRCAAGGGVPGAALLLGPGSGCRHV